MSPKRRDGIAQWLRVAKTSSLPEGCVHCVQVCSNPPNDPKQPETASQPNQAVVNRDPAMCRSEGCIGMPSIRQSIIYAETSVSEMTRGITHASCRPCPRLKEAVRSTDYGILHSVGG